MTWIVVPIPPPSTPTADAATTEGVPQFDAPFRIGANGHVATVEQDTPAEVGAAIYNFVSCPQGAKLNDPTFGLPSPLFGAIPLNTDAVTKAVQAVEPRATISTVAEVVTGITNAVDLDISAQLGGPTN